MRSVALIGPQGSGKTTIAEMLVEHRGYYRHGIADAIKHVADMAYPGLLKEDLRNVVRYSGTAIVSGRGLLQDIGAAMRSVDVDFWLRVWSSDYREMVKAGFKIVVDDVRLPNEVDYLRLVDSDIYVVRLHASPEARAERLGRPLDGSQDVTEAMWTHGEVDLDLDTSGMTIEQAYKAITDRMEGE